MHSSFTPHKSMPATVDGEVPTKEAVYHCRFRAQGCTHGPFKKPVGRCIQNHERLCAEKYNGEVAPPPRPAPMPRRLTVKRPQTMLLLGQQQQQRPMVANPQFAPATKARPKKKRIRKRVAARPLSLTINVTEPVVEQLSSSPPHLSLLTSPVYENHQEERAFFSWDNFPDDMPMPPIVQHTVDCAPPGRIPPHLFTTVEFDLQHTLRRADRCSVLREALTRLKCHAEEALNQQRRMRLDLSSRLDGYVERIHPLPLSQKTRL